jgi:hypothetical protein
MKERRIKELIIYGHSHQNNKSRRTGFATKTLKHQISPKTFVQFGALVFWWQKRMKNLKQLT